MLKTDAIQLFGNATKLAAALDESHANISQLPDVLTLRKADQIRGAAMRLRKKVPRHMRSETASG